MSKRPIPGQGRSVFTCGAITALCLLLAACATGGGFGTGSGSDAAQDAVAGGMGIIGTVTGLGSILVNGYEIDYPRGFAISRNGETAEAGELRPGLVVEVEATGEGRRMNARRIAIRHEVVGPVERVERATGRLTVLGQRVTLAASPGTAAADAPLAIGSVSAGDLVEVSGLRRGDGSIAATRIDRARPGSPVFVRGPVTSADAGGFSIGALRIDAAATVRPPEIQTGREAAIRGVAEGGRFRATLVQAAPALPFGGRVRRLSVEGFLGRAPSGSLAVGTVALTRPAPDSRARPGDRVVMEGALDPRGRLVPSSAAPAGDTSGNPQSLRQSSPEAEQPLRTLPPRDIPRSDRAPLPDRYRR